MTTERESFDAAVVVLERTIDAVERRLSGEPLASARDLVRAVLDVHRMAISDLVQSMRGAGLDFPRDVTRRPAVAWLLALHDLMPESIADRAREAVREAQDSARPG